MAGKHNTDRIHRAWLIAARLMLVMSLWHAPLPWLHCHHFAVDESTSALSQLLVHLSRFHSTAEVCAEPESGWHCHWAMPCWNHALDGTPEDEPVWLEAVTFDPIDVTPPVSLPAEMIAMNAFLHVPTPVAAGKSAFHSLPQIMRHHQPLESEWSVLRC